MEIGAYSLLFSLHCLPAKDDSVGVRSFLWGNPRNGCLKDMDGLKPSETHEAAAAVDCFGFLVEFNFGCSADLTFDFLSRPWGPIGPGSLPMDPLKSQDRSPQNR